MSDTVSTFTHDHVFLGKDHQRNERRIWLVIAVTAAMMVVEIAAGTLYGSMALVADGWHMSTHAGAMLISAVAYSYSRHRAGDRRFTFGTGKLGDLAGFSSAIVLALIAALIGWESLVRLLHPVNVDFHQAIIVAVAGLVVNIVCALLLKDTPHDHGSGSHSHGSHAHHDGNHHHHDHGGHAHHGHHGHHAPSATTDNNIRSAYVHVIADALTSVLAIVALVLGSLYGWVWLDAAMGVIGALVIAQWSIGLMGASGRVLVDYVPAASDPSGAIRTLIETDADTISDLHVWQVGPGHQAAIVAVVTSSTRTPADYKARLAGIETLSHVTVEVTQMPDR